MTPGAEACPPQNRANDIASVFCVDDNPEIISAIRTLVLRTGEFRWSGSLTGVDALVEQAGRFCPDIVLLDIDMPGRDPFEALSELSDCCPDCRAIMLTGHVRRDLVERALECGAWGYVSKNDGEQELLAALRRVVSGEFALSPEARRFYDAPS